jgi:hypothetical protein
MAKKIRLVDAKMEKVVSIIGQASEEITGWAEDAAVSIMTINTTINQINADLAEEKITQEDAAVRFEQEVGKLFGKLENRIKRMTKNTKAMGGLLGALKAMQNDGEEK